MNRDRSTTLDPEKAIDCIKPDGAISRVLHGFEPRYEQQEMLRHVVHAFNDSQAALIEAGTGTGKSLAYLLPSILWAIQKNERTLISTHTIHLQEQLLHKDIPLIKKALGIEIKAVLVKGMGNYVCLRKLHDTVAEAPLLPEQEKNEVERIDGWSRTTLDGSRSDLPFQPDSIVWERVCAESDTCNREKCPFYKKCHFFKARKEAADAHVLIANHSLLFTDLAFRAAKGTNGLLPDYQRVILDEAHNIEEIATENFASKLSLLMIARTLARLYNHRSEKTFGKLSLLKQILHDYYKESHPKQVQTILKSLEIDLPAHNNDVWRQTSVLFQIFHDLIDAHQNTASGEDAQEHKLRILPAQKSHPLWQQEIIPKSQQLIDLINRYVQSLRSLTGSMTGLNDTDLNERTMGLLLDITAYSDRIEQFGEGLDGFVFGEESTDSVRWIEAFQTRHLFNVQLMNAKLDVSRVLANNLFQKIPTTILCSATLTTNNEFKFIRQRLGLVTALLDPKVITENRFDSPFNYAEQSLLIVPTDMPNPSHPDFTKAAVERIWMAIQASRGNAFVLFTSYSMLRQCFSLLEARLKQSRYAPLKQGDNTRSALLKQFREIEGSVLFGTDSFWEGVDVAGDALRCVIIVKLPFKVPSEPLIQARTEAITARGGDPFMEYTVPNAIVKFKQGFGRLIRKKNDRGCIICLDSRLVAKGYGRLFLNSLPPCQKLYVDTPTAQQAMTDFYKKTYHFVKKRA